MASSDCSLVKLSKKKILPLTAKSIIFTFAIMRLALKVIDCKKMKIMEKIWLKKKRIINSLRKSYIFLYTVFYNFFSYCMIQKCFFFFFWYAAYSNNLQCKSTIVLELVLSGRLHCGKGYARCRRCFFNSLRSNNIGQRSR